MKSLFLASALCALFASNVLAAGKDVDVKAADGTMLRATYFSPGKPGPGILLLHMCNSNRGAWAGLGEKLAAAGFHVLTMDYRGYGQSGGKRFDDVTREERRRIVTELWPGDIDKAFEYLVAQPGVDRERVGAGGASCGVNEAIQVARRHPEVKTLVLLAGGTDKAGEELLARTSWMPVFACASQDDGMAVDTMRWMLGFSSNAMNQLKTYDKGGHGTALFAVHADLEPAIVAWFTKHLVTQPARPSPAAAAQPGPSARRAAELREPGAGARLLAELRKARDGKTAFTLPPEPVINALGYEYMQGGRVPDAIQLLTLNVEAHPDSANAYDSLADAYLAAKDAARAAEYARKALDVLARDTRTPEEEKKLVRESAEGKLKPPAAPQGR